MTLWPVASWTGHVRARSWMYFDTFTPERRGMFAPHRPPSPPPFSRLRESIVTGSCSFAPLRHYTWWSMKRRAREVNQGWRIDYTLVDRGMFQFRQDGADNDVESELHDESAVQGVVAGAGILKEQRGSDHCPIYIDFKSIQFPPPPIKPPALSSLHALRKKEAQKNRMMSFFTRRPPVPKVTSDGNDHRDKRVKKCPALSPLLSEDDVQ
eukprot:TRINITY_DN1095_c0_g1_i7.p2 TRINITY_DN1095_c0_g1~~TRINITY_DN1095_c0_g1_i7.p2  ORF type:complete len:210 (-),score=10.96 TRINITY_DN1095_c0_g1_i7:42-671(-)